MLKAYLKKAKLSYEVLYAFFLFQLHTTDSLMYKTVGSDAWHNHLVNMTIDRLGAWPWQSWSLKYVYTPTHPPPTSHHPGTLVHELTHENNYATYVRYVTDTMHTVQYSDSQCTVYSAGVHTAAPETAPDKPITFELSLVNTKRQIVIKW